MSEQFPETQSFPRPQNEQVVLPAERLDLDGVLDVSIAPGTSVNVTDGDGHTLAYVTRPVFDTETRAPLYPDRFVDLTVQGHKPVGFVVRETTDTVIKKREATVSMEKPSAWIVYKPYKEQ